MKKDKSKELFGLMKIPDHILNRRLLVERGQRESYIEELEDKVKLLEAELYDCKINHCAAESKM